MAGRSALILLGDRCVARDLRTQLEQLGYAVEICETTDQALRGATARGPDVVIVGTHGRGIVDAIEAALMLGQLDVAVVLMLRPMSGAQLQGRLELELNELTKRRAHRASLRRARILALDQDDAIRRLLSLSLQGYEVVVTDAVQALRHLQSGERYDLVLLDMEMPSMSATEFHRTLQELDAEQARRVVFVTAGAESASDAELLATTNCRVLQKPYDKRALTTLVAEELRRA